MRVSDNMNYGQVSRNVSKNRAENLDLQTQSATQKRVNKASDDPVAMVKTLATRTELVGTEQYLRNLNSAKAFLDFSEQSLAEVSDYLVRAKELAIQQSNAGSATPETRQAVAGEINQICKQLIQIGNRKLGERFVFGGFKTTESPFNAAGEYKGDIGQMMVEMGKGSFVSMNLPGNYIFMGDKLDFSSTVDEKGEVPQTLPDLLQTVEANRQLPPPTRDATPPGANPALQEPESAPSSVPLRGPASVGQQSGDPVGMVEHGENIFSVLQDLEIGLKTNDISEVQSSLSRIDTALEQVVAARAHLGTRQSAIQAQSDSLQKFRVDSKDKISQLEDVDIYQLYNDLARSENTLKATMASSGKVVQLSLLDFLR